MPKMSPSAEFSASRSIPHGVMECRDVDPCPASLASDSSRAKSNIGRANVPHAKKRFSKIRHDWTGDSVVGAGVHGEQNRTA